MSIEVPPIFFLEPLPPGVCMFHGPGSAGWRLWKSKVGGAAGPRPEGPRNDAGAVVGRWRFHGLSGRSYNMSFWSNSHRKWPPNFEWKHFSSKAWVYFEFPGGYWTQTSEFWPDESPRCPRSLEASLHRQVLRAQLGLNWVGSRSPTGWRAMRRPGPSPQKMAKSPIESHGSWGLMSGWDYWGPHGTLGNGFSDCQWMVTWLYHSFQRWSICGCQWIVHQLEGRFRADGAWSFCFPHWIRAIIHNMKQHFVDEMNAKADLWNPAIEPWLWVKAQLGISQLHSGAFWPQQLPGALMAGRLLKAGHFSCENCPVRPVWSASGSTMGWSSEPRAHQTSWGLMGSPEFLAPVFPGIGERIPGNLIVFFFRASNGKCQGFPHVPLWNLDKSEAPNPLLIISRVSAVSPDLLGGSRTKSPCGSTWIFAGPGHGSKVDRAEVAERIESCNSHPNRRKNVGMPWKHNGNTMDIMHDVIPVLVPDVLQNTSQNGAPNCPATPGKLHAAAAYQASREKVPCLHWSFDPALGWKDPALWVSCKLVP